MTNQPPTNTQPTTNQHQPPSETCGQPHTRCCPDIPWLIVGEAVFVMQDSLAGSRNSQRQKQWEQFYDTFLLNEVDGVYPEGYFEAAQHIVLAAAALETAKHDLDLEWAHDKGAYTLVLDWYKTTQEWAKWVVEHQLGVRRGDLNTDDGRTAREAREYLLLGVARHFLTQRVRRVCQDELAAFIARMERKYGPDARQLWTTEEQDLYARIRLEFPDDDEENHER